MKYWIRHSTDEAFSKAMSYGFIEGAFFAESEDFVKNRKLAPGKFIAIRPVQTADVMNVFDLASLCVKDMRAAGFTRPALLFNFDYYSIEDLKFLPQMKNALKDTIIIAAGELSLISSSLFFESNVDYILYRTDKTTHPLDFIKIFDAIKKLRDHHLYKTRLILTVDDKDDLNQKIALLPDAVCLTDRRFLELF
jgi:hypothetical protein